MVKRKSVREALKDPQPDECYVLVTRYYPMEFRMRALKLEETPIRCWDTTLAPSRELLKDYKSGKIDWPEYERRFREEVPKTSFEKKMKLLSALAEGKEIVFVCTEENTEYPHCHTWILLEYLRTRVLPDGTLRDGTIVELPA